MLRRFFPLLAVVVLPLPLVLALRSAPAGSRPAPASYKGPLGLWVDQNGRKAYVALHRAGTVAVVDLRAGTVRQEIPVGKGPFDLVVARGTAYVTCEGDDSVAAIDLGENVVRRRFRVGQAPRGLAASADGSRVWVVCRDEEWQSQQTDGRTLLIGSYTAGASRLAVSSQEKSDWLVALGRGGWTGTWREPRAKERSMPTTAMGQYPSAGNMRGLAVCNERILVAHQRPKSKIPTTQVNQGWVFTNAVGVTRFSQQPTIGFPQVAILDDPTRGFADPSDLVVTPDGGCIFVASAGADTALALDMNKLANRHSDFGNAKQDWFSLRPDDPFPPLLGGYQSVIYDNYHQDDLTESRHFITAKIPTQAHPRRLALSGDGKTLVVSNYLGDSLTVIDTATLKVTRTILLGGPPPDAARRGEILFNSARMTLHQQFTCASCHPNGESDGLNWDLTRDGIGNFKNTKSLLGVADTAPYGWHGSSPTLADRVQGTLRTMHRHEPTGTEVEDIVAYLQSLPPPRPLPVKDADRPAVARGKVLFEGKARCIACHHRAGYDDDKLHDVGTRGPGDAQDAFNTPSLRGVARSAPYLHDGRAATLEEIFTKHNSQHRHGAAHRLTEGELSDLVAFLKSL